MRRIRAALAAGLGALLAVTGLAGCGPFGEDTITVSAHFTSGVGLFVGNDVDVLGVPVGSVTEVTPQGTSVLVEMEIPADLQVPADAGALIIPPSVITDRYVELTPVWTSGPVITDGAVIPLERTRTPVEFDRIVRALDELAVSLNADQRTVGAIQDALGVAADNLDGNGTRINRSIKGLSTAIGTLADNRGDLTALIRSLDGLTAAFARNDTTIRQFSRNLTEATEVLADNGDRLNSTVRALSVALTEVGDFVRKNTDGTKGALQALTDVLEVVNTHRAELTEALDVLPLTFQNLTRAVDPRSDRLVSQASAAANILNPVVAQQICDGFGPFFCASAGKPVAGSFSGGFGQEATR